MKTYPITDETMKIHFSESYFVKFLVMIIDQETGKELHSEEVAITFIERESKYFYGLDRQFYHDVESLMYWLKSNTRHYLQDIEKPHSGIFFTNNQIERFESLVLSLKGKNVKYDACHIGTVSGDALAVKEMVRRLKNRKDSVIWLGEFI